jgi:hypothetical protein
LPQDILFPKCIVKEDCPHIVWVGQIGGWTEVSKFEKVVDCLGISLYRCRTKNLPVNIIDATLDVINVDSHDPYKSFIVTTWIWYAKDLGPLYGMSLPSGLCFKIWTSS